MRQLKECTAEVFRRSEERIRKRRSRRIRMMTVGVPLCLALGLLTAFWDGGQNETDTVYGGVLTAGTKSEQTSENIAVADGTVLQEEALSQQVSPGQQLYNYIQTFFPVQGASSETVKIVGCTLQSPEKGTYTVTFECPDQGLAVYKLEGDLLLDVGSGREAVLTTEQWAQLEKLLEEVD